jgi:hypothetical protein
MARSRRSDRFNDCVSRVGAGAFTPHHIRFGVRGARRVPPHPTTTNLQASRRPSGEVPETLRARGSARSRGQLPLHHFVGNALLWILGSVGTAPYEDSMARHHGRSSHYLPCRAHRQTLEETSIFSDSLMGTLDPSCVSFDVTDGAISKLRQKRPPSAGSSRNAWWRN